MRPADCRHWLSLPKAQPGERVPKRRNILIRLPGVGGNLLVGHAAEHAGLVRETLKFLLRRVRSHESGLKHGYDRLGLGFGDIREKLVNKPRKGQFDKAGTACKRFVREFKLENAADYKVADEIKADIFAAGDKVDATAISKGKGFQGAIKRHGQHRGPMAHGSKFHRHAGSNGAASDPSKVFKGKKMPGQMGNKRITIQNLEVVRVDAEKNLLLVKGAVPGPKKCLVTIKETVKAV